MIELHFCSAQRADETLFGLLKSKTGENPDILRTQNGQPYLDGNPLYFSLTHSGNAAAIALCDKPVGVDMELFKNKRHLPILSRFPDEEQAEILGEKDFLTHWTVREAFVKYTGGTLAHMLKSMTYYGGNLYFCGEKQDVELTVYEIDGGVVALCTDAAENKQVKI